MPGGGVFAVIIGSKAGSKIDALQVGELLLHGVGGRERRQVGRTRVLNAPAACAFSAASCSSSNVNDGRNFCAVISL